MKLHSFVKLGLVIILGTLAMPNTNAQSLTKVEASKAIQEQTAVAIDGNTERIISAVSPKTVIFENRSTQSVRYIVKMKNPNGKEEIWQSGYLSRNASKLLSFQDNKTEIVSIQMVYKDGFNWKVYNLDQFGKQAKLLPQKVTFTGISSQKPVINVY